jgi:hypothetical protein
VARITDEGLRAIGIDPNEGDVVVDTAPAAEPIAPEDGNPTSAVDAPRGVAATIEVATPERVRLSW